MPTHIFGPNFRNQLAKKKFYMILKASSSNCFLKSEHMPWLAYSARLVDITQLHQEQEQQLDLMLYKAYFGCLLFSSAASQVFPSSLSISHWPFHAFILASSASIYISMLHNRIGTTLSMHLKASHTTHATQGSSKKSSNQCNSLELWDFAFPFDGNQCRGRSLIYTCWSKPSSPDVLVSVLAGE